MKKLLCVLCFVVIASPVLAGPPDRCPCFNDLMIAGMCAAAEEVRLTVGPPTWDGLFCTFNDGSEWGFYARNPYGSGVTDACDWQGVGRANDRIIQKKEGLSEEVGAACLAALSEAICILDPDWWSCP